MNGFHVYPCTDCQTYSRINNSAYSVNRPTGMLELLDLYARTLCRQFNPRLEIVCLNAGYISHSTPVAVMTFGQRPWFRSKFQIYYITGFETTPRLTANLFKDI
jgi:hypothetical protein